jgi:hypothetical protein
VHVRWQCSSRGADSTGKRPNRHPHSEDPGLIMLPDGRLSLTCAKHSSRALAPLDRTLLST